MAETKRRQKTGGRTKGTPNRRTQAVVERLEELNCDPIEGMVIVSKNAMAAGDYQLAGSMFKELAQYVFPKRKAIDHTLTNSESDEIFINFQQPEEVKNANSEGH